MAQYIYKLEKVAIAMHCNLKVARHYVSHYALQKAHNAPE